MDYYILVLNNQQNDVINEYKCFVCNKKFLSENELLTHCKIIHRPITTNFDNNTDCAYCETCEMLYKEDSYTDHFPCNAVDIRCFFCLTTMPMKSHFSSHNLTYHSWRKFQCNLCEINTKEMTFGELNEHMRLHNEFGCGVYQCMNCDLFMEKSALPGHVEQCLRGCRCFNMNEICVCDKFNEAFYITKILLADIALNFYKKSNMNVIIEDWNVEFEDEKFADPDNISRELNDKDNSVIPTLLLEVESEQETTFLEDDESETMILENNRIENLEDEIDIKNLDIQNISAEFPFENYQKILSNLKTEDPICVEEESQPFSENIPSPISNFTSEQNEENTESSSHDIEHLSDSEISYLKHKRGRKKDINKCVVKKQKKSESSASECVVCGLKFEKELELHYHGIVHHRPWAVEMLKDVFCARCKSWFDSEYEYESHHPCSKEPVTNRCPICCMQFPFKEHFLLHNVNFISYRRLKCLLCKNSSIEYQIYQLNKHRKTEHNKNGVFECLKCEVNFEKPCDLKRHLVESCSNNDVESIAETYKLKINDTDIPKHFKCDICNKKLFTKKTLNEHRATHDNHCRIKLCFVCGQTFKNSCNFADHVNTHLKTKTYDCSSCDKKFFKRNYLIQHERIHEKTKKFPCVLCSKTFTHQTSLIYHMAGHTKENVFVCSVCGTKWDTQRKLTSHMDVHNANGTNPHKCHVCLKYFTHKCNLLVHMRMHAETSKDK